MAPRRETTPRRSARSIRDESRNRKGREMLTLTADQATAIAIVVVMLGIFVWDKWRYDVVAMGALLAALAVGIVPQEKAFVGFSDQVIVVMASVLVVSKAIARSGMLDRFVRRLLKG